MVLTYFNLEIGSNEDFYFGIQYIKNAKASKCRKGRCPLNPDFNCPAVGVPRDAHKLIIARTLTNDFLIQIF